MSEIGINRPLAGIGHILVAHFLFSASDAITKGLLDTYSPGQILFIRGMIALAVVLPFLIHRLGWRALFRTDKPMAHIARAALAAGETLAFFWAISKMPLADATAIYFAAPLLMVLLSIPLLGEKVGLHRFLAVIVGFFGVLLVVQPGSDGIPTAAWIALVGMALYSLILVMTRWLARTESDASLLVYPLIGLTVGGGLLSPAEWVHPPLQDWALMGALGLLTAVGVHLLNRAFVMAPVSVIAPLEYLYLLWAVMYGYLFWDEFPSITVWAGTGLIVAMGIYILHREARMKKRSLSATVHGGPHT